MERAGQARAFQNDDKPAFGRLVKARPLRRSTAATNAACVSRRAAAKEDVGNSLAPTASHPARERAAPSPERFVPENPASARPGKNPARLQLSTRALHDALVQVYQALCAKEKNLELALAVEDGASPAALAEFLRLAGAGAGEFGASLSLEITDRAGLFRQDSPARPFPAPGGPGVTFGP